MLNEGAADCLLPITRKGSEDIVDNKRPDPRPHCQHPPSYPNQLVKKWIERVDRCLEQQWKDSQHLLSFAKALKDSGGTIINSDEIVKELSGLGFAMMQKSIDLRQEIVNESYNSDFFDFHIEKPTYHHENNHHHSSQLALPNQYAYSRPAVVGVLNSSRQKCSSSFYLPSPSHLNRNTPPLVSKVQKKSPSLDNSPYKIPSQVSCHGYTSYSYQQQRTRSNSFTHHQLPSSSSDKKKLGVPILSSSPSISNVCGLSLSDNGDIIKDHQHDNNDNDNDSTNKNSTLQHQCTCNTGSSTLGKITMSDCQHCISNHATPLDSKNTASNRSLVTPSLHSNSATTISSSGKEDSPLVNNNSRIDGINDEQTTENNDTANNENREILESPSSSPTDTTTIPSKTSAATPVATSLAVHITPSTPSSSSSMIHTMSTKFHFTRSTTSITATDKNKTISRSSSSSSSYSSSSSLSTPLDWINNNKDGGKASPRFVQSLLGRKTSPPALSSSKKDHPLSLSKTDT